jgi:hypothetical protein
MEAQNCSNLRAASDEKREASMGPYFFEAVRLSMVATIERAADVPCERPTFRGEQEKAPAQGDALGSCSAINARAAAFYSKS